MTTYVAFLRGVNVGGHNRVTMDDLRALFESIGYDDVRSYIQSGNVVFESPETDESALATAIEDAIAEAFGYDVAVMVRTREALDAVVAGQPFDESGEDSIKRYVTFLDEAPTAERVEALLDAGNDGELFVVLGREVYSRLDRPAMAEGRRTDVESVLGVAGTRRNWNVVTSVRDLASA